MTTLACLLTPREDQGTKDLTSGEEGVLRRPRRAPWLAKLLRHEPIQHEAGSIPPPPAVVSVRSHVYVNFRLGPRAGAMPRACTLRAAGALAAPGDTMTAAPAETDCHTTAASRWLELLALILVAVVAGSCLTRSGFERDRARLECALHGACKRRQCDALRASSEPDDRQLYELTCPARQLDCEPPDYGDYGASEPPGSDCADFHADRARQCLAELEALLEVSETTPLTDDIFCWKSSPVCSEVYSEIDWPDCPLEK